ncbi:MAG: glycosyltransferase [Pyrinomonadaceae bacterium]
MLVFYFFAVFQIFLGYKSLRGGIDFLSYFKRELRREKAKFGPFASVIIPCRGIDKGLKENLRPLFNQEYDRYEIIFVVDNKRDPALPVIEELAGEHGDAKIVVAGKATDSGQKVHNLRSAVLEIDEESRVLVFMDSDARPDDKWLANLVEPLENPEIGCTTGYRWFIQKNGGFSTHLRSVWNASIASQLGENSGSNFCWGGSMAIRRETFENLDIRAKWKNTLSDDFALTKALSDARMPVYFVPQCLTASVEDCNFRELLEFTTRQMKITRVYSPLLWAISLISAVVFNLIFWGGIAIMFFASGLHFWIILVLVVLIFALGFGKAQLRLAAVKLVLRDYEKEIAGQTFPQVILWTLTPFLFLYNNISAVISRKIVWRGIEYELKSAKETAIIRRIS